MESDVCILISVLEHKIKALALTADVQELKSP